MSSDSPVVRVAGVGKCYHIYAKPVDRLKQSLYANLRRLAPQVLPARNYYREFWALRDISFSVLPGEVIGLMGRNGSGKSTLLQMIAGTLTPTVGEASTRGHVAALLELGAGFNMEFTGRENTYLNASLLGLSQEEIDKHFDAIAAFADIGDFIEQPVKTYSSGMYVRLAYAVQTCIRPDVLIVDEALAVGDFAFQRKCFDHMQRLVASGTTVLLVTHDVHSIRALCTRAIWLDRGRQRLEGDPKLVTDEYIRDLFESQSGGGGKTAAPTGDDAAAPACRRRAIMLRDVTGLRRWGTAEVQVVGYLLLQDNCPAAFITHGRRVELEFTVKAMADVALLDFAFSFKNAKGLDVCGTSTRRSGKGLGQLRAGEQAVVSFAFTNPLQQGEYHLVLAIEHHGMDGGRTYHDYVENLQVTCVTDHVVYHMTDPSADITVRPIEGWPAAEGGLEGVG